MEQSPEALLAQARVKYPGLTRDEYTLARVMASENFSGSAIELAVRGDCDLNKSSAKGLSVFDHAAPRGVYGRQGSGGRPVATSRDPGPRHIAVAFALMRRQIAVLPPPARGVARGGVQYFDPKTQDDLYRGWRDGTSTRTIATTCGALDVLEKWTYGYPKNSITRAEAQSGEICFTRTAPRRALEWVGYVDGIDAYRGPMIMRPATSRQDELFSAAVRVIKSRGVDQQGDVGSDPGVTGADLVAMAALAAVAAMGVA